MLPCSSFSNSPNGAIIRHMFHTIELYNEKFVFYGIYIHVAWIEDQNPSFKQFQNIAAFARAELNIIISNCSTKIEGQRNLESFGLPAKRSFLEFHI